MVVSNLIYKANNSIYNVSIDDFRLKLKSRIGVWLRGRIESDRRFEYCHILYSSRDGFEIMKILRSEFGKMKQICEIREYDDEYYSILMNVNRWIIDGRDGLEEFLMNWDNYLYD